MGLWTLTHFFNIIPAFIVYIVLAFLLAKPFSKMDEKKRLIPFKALALILLVLEVMKQIKSFEGGYDLYSLPFHYCSLFLYLLPLHSFYHGKYKKAVDAATLACTSSLFLFMLIMPAVVFPESAITGFFSGFMDTHTILFHYLVCIYFLLMLSAGFYRFEPKYDLKVVTVFLAAYVMLATILSFTLKTNYQNLYRCHLAMVEEIRLAMVASIGWLGHAIYVAVLFVLTILFAFLSYYLTKWILALIANSSKKSNTEKDKSLV